MHKFLPKYSFVPDFLKTMFLVTCHLPPNSYGYAKSSNDLVSADLWLIESTFSLFSVRKRPLADSICTLFVSSSFDRTTTASLNLKLSTGIFFLIFYFLPYISANRTFWSEHESCNQFVQT